MKDYCSFSPDHIDSYDLSGCCALHDEDYEEQIKSRKQADIDLFN